MNLILGESGPKLRERDLASLERDVGHPLPIQYRKFLLATNGGIPGPKDCMYAVDFPGPPGGGADVQEFLGLNTELESSDIRWNIDVFSDRIDITKLLPVACDSGGRLFCLSLSRENVGSVTFVDWIDWAHEHDGPRHYVVAKDFDSFFAKIKEYDE